MSILEARKLSHRFPQADLFSDFSLDIRRGECVVIIGANGSGKTTLLKLLAQADQPQSGSVTLYNPDGSLMKDATRRIYVGQHDFSRFDAFPATALTFRVPDERIARGIHLTINGIASGLRNSG